MEFGKPSHIVRAVWSSGIRFGFSVFLLILAYTAFNSSFWIAAVVFAIFAIGIGTLGFRKFTSELDNLKYVDSVDGV